MGDVTTTVAHTCMRAHKLTRMEPTQCQQQFMQAPVTA